VRFRQLSLEGKLLGFGAIVVFIALLGVGYLYAWRKGALEWD